MTKSEVIKAFCEIQALAYLSIGNSDKAADCFCVCGVNIVLLTTLVTIMMVKL